MNGTTAPRSWSLSPARALALPGAFIVAVALAGVLIAREHAVMFASFMGAAASAAVWAGVLYVRARKEDRTLTLVVGAKSVCDGRNGRPPPGSVPALLGRDV